MSGPIRLTDDEGGHLGFLLLAGRGYPIDAHSFEGRCVFMPLPTDPSLLEGDGYLALAEHRDAGEHRYSMARMGTQQVLTITGPHAEQIEVVLASDQPGTWSISRGGLKRVMGRAHSLAKP